MRYEKYKKFLSWNFEILNHNSDVFLRWMQCASISLEPIWGFLAALWDFLTLFQENEIFKGWKLPTDVMRRFFYSVKLWINFCSGRNISPPTSLKMILISVFFFFRAVVVRSGAPSVTRVWTPVRRPHDVRQRLQCLTMKTMSDHFDLCLLNLERSCHLQESAGVSDANTQTIIVQWDFDRYLTLGKLPILL